MRGRDDIGVVVFPVNANPYQELLYNALAASGGVRVRRVVRYPRLGSLNYLAVVVRERLRGFTVVHLHWPAFGLPTWLDRSGRWTALVTRFSLWLTRRLGYRVVWTVHNLAPHQQESQDDAAIMRLHRRAADVQIVHSERSAAALAAEGLAGARVAVIPHGNYVGHYHSTRSRAETRAALNIAAGDTVFLFLGQVRPYKGVPMLAAAFQSAGLPHAELVIAGEIADTEVPSEPPAGVRVMDGFVSDADVANLMEAADVVCLPFLRVTTSGSALLALSFGKPVVASRVGDLADLPPEVGWFFEPGDREGLVGALRQAAMASVEAREARAAAALDEAGRRNWSDIARATLANYRA